MTEIVDSVTLSIMRSVRSVAVDVIVVKVVVVVNFDTRLTSSLLQFKRTKIFM